MGWYCTRNLKWKFLPAFANYIFFPNKHHRIIPSLISAIKMFSNYQKVMCLFHLQIISSLAFSFLFKSFENLIMKFIFNAAKIFVCKSDKGNIFNNFSTNYCEIHYFFIYWINHLISIFIMRIYKNFNCLIFMQNYMNKNWYQFYRLI